MSVHCYFCCVVLDSGCPHTSTCMYSSLEYLNILTINDFWPGNGLGKIPFCEREEVFGGVKFLQSVSSPHSDTMAF